MKKKIIAQIKNADISHDGWAYKIVDNCEGDYSPEFIRGLLSS